VSAATVNLAEALLQLGDWDAAAGELSQAIAAEELASFEELRNEWAWLVALRGDASVAAATLAGLAAVRASESPQEKTGLSVAEAYVAAADGRPGDALRFALETLAARDALGINYTYVRWSWPLAVRSAFELGDIGAVHELLGMLAERQPGQLAPMLKAERELARARLAALDGDAAAAELFVAAVGRLRELSTPYHLAQGLLDYAEYLRQHGDVGAAAVVDEARQIGERLGCQPVLARAAEMAAQALPGS